MSLHEPMLQFIELSIEHGQNISNRIALDAHIKAVPQGNANSTSEPVLKNSEVSTPTAHYCLTGRPT